VSDGRVEVQVGEDGERTRRGHELDAGTLACHRGGGSKKARIMTSRVPRSAHAVPRASRERVCGRLFCGLSSHHEDGNLRNISLCCYGPSLED
jgi:hypothetical protein